MDTRLALGLFRGPWCWSGRIRIPYHGEHGRESGWMGWISRAASPECSSRCDRFSRLQGWESIETRFEMTTAVVRRVSKRPGRKRRRTHGREGARCDGRTSGSSGRFVLGTPVSRDLDAAPARAEPARFRDRFFRPGSRARPVFRRCPAGPRRTTWPPRGSMRRALQIDRRLVRLIPEMPSPGTTWRAATRSWA